MHGAGMKRRAISNRRTLSMLCELFLLAGASRGIAAEPPAAAAAAFNAYVGGVETRLVQEHRSAGEFLVPVDAARLRRGELIVERVTADGGEGLPGAMLHDWRGTAFVPGARATDFERLMKNFDAYPQRFAPQVMQAKVVAQQGDHVQAVMRVRQKHGITVVMDTAYDVRFARLDAQHGYSISRSTRITEVDAAGTAKERALNASEEHGFLWRLNTYWSYEERDGGLYMQVESVSLTRAIPAGLGWLIGPFVESVPRDSLEFTLRATCDALRR
jgi:hypothetical protein